MSEVRVEVKGLDEMRRKLEKFSGIVQGQLLEKAALAGAEVIRAEAARGAPRGTQPVRAGRARLDESIQKLLDKELAGGSVEVTIGPSGRASHGLFVEFGTGKMAARPFLGPAAQMKAQEAIETFAETMRRLIDSTSL